MSEAEIMVFGGSASCKLTTKICRHLGIKASAGEVHCFSEGNVFVRIKENVRGEDVYLVQGTAFPVNDNFMELLFWIDAFKRASAERVTVIIPYFSYAKGDKKDEPRVSIRARVCADAIEAAGADRIVTMDLHAPQIQGFFRIPVDDLYALAALCDAVKAAVSHDIVVVSPDAGFAKKARAYANYLDAPLAIAHKSRREHNEKAEVLELIGDVQGKTAIVVDDFTISAGTLTSAADKLMERGAESVLAALTHGVFSVGAKDTLDAGRIRKVFITDTVETQPEALSEKVEIVSVAPLFGEAIRRIHDRQSISDLLSSEKTQRHVDPESLGAVPLGVPLITGPAVLTTSVLLLNEHGLVSTGAALTTNILIAGVIFSFANRIHRLLGKAGARTISKVASLLLAAIGVMIVRRGVMAIIAGVTNHFSHSLLAGLCLEQSPDLAKHGHASPLDPPARAHGEQQEAHRFP